MATATTRAEPMTMRATTMLYFGHYHLTEKWSPHKQVPNNMCIFYDQFESTNHKLKVLAFRVQKQRQLTTSP